MDEIVPSQDPIVFLITPAIQSSPHDHTAVLAKAGFCVVPYLPDEASVREVLRVEPSIIVVELGREGRAPVLDLVQRLKTHTLSRAIPIVVYGVGLTAGEIATMAHAGALWLQLKPTEGFKLLAAIRGVLRATPFLSGVLQ